MSRKATLWYKTHPRRGLFRVTNPRRLPTVTAPTPVSAGTSEAAQITEQPVRRHRLRPVVGPEICVGPAIHEYDAAAKEVSRIRQHETHPSAICPASPKPPSGTGNDRTALACLGVDSCSCSNGVMTAPGARAFKRMPDAAHSGRTAFRRTQRPTAIFDAAYTRVGAAGPKICTDRNARSASCASNALTVRPGTAGTVVEELLATTTTLARSVAARVARRRAARRPRGN